MKKSCKNWKVFSNFYTLAEEIYCDNNKQLFIRASYAPDVVGFLFYPVLYFSSFHIHLCTDIFFFTFHALYESSVQPFVVSASLLRGFFYVLLIRAVHTHLCNHDYHIRNTGTDENRQAIFLYSHLFWPKKKKRRRKGRISRGNTGPVYRCTESQ